MRRRSHSGRAGSIAIRVNSEIRVGLEEWKENPHLACLICISMMQEKNSTEKMQKLAAWLTENAPQVQDGTLQVT